MQPASSYFQQAPAASFYPTQQPSSAIQVGVRVVCFRNFFKITIEC